MRSPQSAKSNHQHMEPGSSRALAVTEASVRLWLLGRAVTCAPAHKRCPGPRTSLQRGSAIAFVAGAVSGRHVVRGDTKP